jgi:hypothetical protein
MLPFESEKVIHSTQCQLSVDESPAAIAVVVSVISSVASPMEYCLLIADDLTEPESPATTTTAAAGFLLRMKSLAKATAERAVKVQRQVLSTSPVADMNLRFTIPLCNSVEGKVGEDLIELNYFNFNKKMIIFKLSQFKYVPNHHDCMQICRDPEFSTQFALFFEISSKNVFMANGSNGQFNWVWKYQPVIPSALNSSPRSVRIPPTVTPLSRGLVYSWNVGGLPPPESNSDIVNFLSSKIASNVEFVILSLQECSPLNPTTVLFNNSKSNFGESWLDYFQDSLPGGGWTRAGAIIQVGLGLAVFVRGAVVAKGVVTGSIRTGTLGLTGNKGCVGLRSELSVGGDYLSVTVLNVHLASGDGKCEFRKIEINRIVNDLFFNSIHSFESDFFVLTGDLNSRVDESIVCSGVEIPAQDELITRMAEEGDTFPFEEDPVRFPATYKLVPGQGGRLVFVDNRRPAWCDRVLFRSSSKDVRFNCREYNSVREIDYSDHSPIYALFSLDVAGGLREVQAVSEGRVVRSPVPRVAHVEGNSDDENLINDN